MVSMRGRAISIPALKKTSKIKKVVLEFPVVVCNSFEKLYQVGFDVETDPEVIAENFQLEVKYAYVDRAGNNLEEYFLLDFVEISQLEKYCDVIKEDINAAAYLGLDLW